MTEIKPRYVEGEPVLFTNEEIDESIVFMEKRLESGQGTRSDAMCRLSLRMAKALQADRDKYRSDALTMAKRYKEAIGERDQCKDLLFDEIRKSDYLEVKGNELRQERDEARRELVRFLAHFDGEHMSEQEIAKQRGWEDCFEEAGE